MRIDSRHPADQTMADQQPEKPVSRTPRPSTLQIVASALAAMTTTALLATLGVAGTIVGAALASVITVLANFVYTTSISRTADKVVATVPVQKVRTRYGTAVTEAVDRPRTILVAGELVAVDGTADGERPDGSAADPDGQAGAPADDRRAAAAADPDGRASAPEGAAPALAGDGPDRGAAAPPQRRGALRSVVDRFGWRRIGGAIAVVFVLVLAAVTVVELTAGKPLTDVVRNQEGSGTSLFGTTTVVPSPPAEDGVAPGTGPADVPATDPDVAVDPEPTQAPTPEEPAPTVPTEEAPTVPEDSVPPPAGQENPGPAEDVAPGAAPRPVPEPTPAPTPTPGG